MKTTLSVPSISCGHCKKSIEGAVRPLAGVDRVEVKIDQKLVELEFDEQATSLAAITQAIEDQGHDVAGEAR